MLRLTLTPLPFDGEVTDVPEACFTLARPSTRTHAFSIAEAPSPMPILRAADFFLSLPASGRRGAADTSAEGTY